MDLLAIRHLLLTQHFSLEFSRYRLIFRNGNYFSISKVKSFSKAFFGVLVGSRICDQIYVQLVWN
ncbi:5-hydroxyisourate hydrolase-like protein (transthyretin family) [Paenibacillus sp. BK720]|nr:5-hydroxyisourate hydrolase-like protein (transthyretin family) [Paenibacillus sp. BK720]